MNGQYQTENSAIFTDKQNEMYEIANVVETKMLYLSTKSSQSMQLNGDMKSHVSFDIKSYLDFQGDPSIQSVTISMPYAIICNSNYQINQYNCKLDMNVNGVFVTYNFPYSNYSSDTFIAQFLLLVGVGWGISLDPVTVRFTITQTVYPFTLLGTSTCDYIMGFNDNVVAIGSGPYTATCPRVINFLPNPIFRIVIENNSLYNGQVLGAEGQAGYSNVLASIPNVTKQNTQIVYQNLSDEFTIQLSGQTTLTLGVLDDNGNFVDFNGVSSYYQLRIRIYRKIKRSLNQFHHVLGGATNLRTQIEEKSENIEKPIHQLL
jgi:hypothetical protein